MDEFKAFTAIMSQLNAGNTKRAKIKTMPDCIKTI